MTLRDGTGGFGGKVCSGDFGADEEVEGFAGGTVALRRRGLVSVTTSSSTIAGGFLSTGEVELLLDDEELENPRCFLAVGGEEFLLLEDLDDDEELEDFELVA